MKTTSRLWCILCPLKYERAEKLTYLGLLRLPRQALQALPLDQELWWEALKELVLEVGVAGQLLHLVLQEWVGLPLRMVVLAEELVIGIEGGESVDEPPLVGHPGAGRLDAFGLLLELLLYLLVQLLHQNCSGRRFGAGTRLEVGELGAVDLPAEHRQHQLLGEPMLPLHGQGQAVPQKDLVEVLEGIVVQDEADGLLGIF